MKRVLIHSFVSFLLLAAVFSCTKIATPTSPELTATPTATAGDTGTATVTATEQDTPENTATVTPTYSSTDTATETATPTFTDTATFTFTVTGTFTDTATVTPTFTATATNTAVHTFISEFGSSGTLDTEFDYVRGMCHDENDNLYIVDQNTSRVKVYNSAGEFQTAWGTHGTADTDLQYPNGICYDGSEYLYISDTSNYKIKVYTKAGVYVRAFGSMADFGGYPRQLVLNSGSIYVMAPTKVVKYSASSGALQGTYGTSGTGIGQLNNSHGLFVDNDGNMYCGAVGNSKIVKLDSSGNFVNEWAHNWGANLLQDAGGNIMATVSSGSAVRIYTLTGIYVTQFGTYGSGTGQLMEPSALSVDSQGNVFVADNTRDKVLKYSR